MSQDSHQWSQFDHHDTLECQLTDYEQQAVIDAVERHNEHEQSFDDVIAEVMKKESVK